MWCEHEDESWDFTPKYTLIKKEFFFESVERTWPQDFFRSIKYYNKILLTLFFLSVALFKYANHTRYTSNKIKNRNFSQGETVNIVKIISSGECKIPDALWKRKKDARRKRKIKTWERGRPCLAYIWCEIKTPNQLPVRQSWNPEILLNNCFQTVQPVFWIGKKMNL